MTFLSLSCAAEATAPTAALTPVKPTVTVATVTPTLPIYAIPIRTPRSVALEATAQAEAAATPVATVTPVVTVTPVGAGASGPTPIVSGPTPTPTPAPSPTDTPVPTDTPTPPPTDTPTPTPTVTPTPTPTPGPVFGQEFADRELAKIQEFIPFRTVRGDLAQLCSELNQLIATINVPDVARTVDEYLNIIAADYWSGVGVGYSVPTFQGLPAPGLIVGAAETILCLPPPTPAPTTVPTPTAVPTATPTPVPTATPAPTVSPTAMPIPSPTPAASPVPTPTPGPAATGQIDSLDAQVTALKFFEGPLDLPPGMERAYSQNFNRSDTRYVYWELSLTHPPAGQPQPLVINAAYTRSDGTLYIQHTYSTTVPTNSISTTHGRGSGFSDPGQWSADSYRVDLSVEGVLVATDTFQVTG